ncbi:unnamed protein product [Rodentolepis nana]|uniref:Nucleosome assembly protein n=1 Tax=Rodentolepis nana TaxID=102285 RepID=A0A0R3TN29_RODNA|nr:unnamed protein product [Rodentolepis nana]
MADRHLQASSPESLISDQLSFIQNIIDGLSEEGRDEIRKVKKHYKDLIKDQYHFRTKIITEIPNFWQIVLINHSVIRKIITKEDKEVLAFLHAVEVEEYEDKINSGYKINFYFLENRWFTNHCLTREYLFKESQNSIVNVPTMRWNKGMCLFDNGKDVDEEGYSNRSGFFSWLQFERKAVGDTIGVYIKEELWPNPFKYYFNSDPNPSERGACKGMRVLNTLRFRLQFQVDMASQPKKARTENDIPDNAPNVDHAVLESVDAVQEAIDSLNKKASVEILKVEQKYNKLRKPHYEHRARLLANIPAFWQSVFINHRHMRRLVTEDDQKVLAFLRAVEVQEFEDITSGYKINFFFDENDWFTNDCLTREYHVGAKGEPIVTATKINWKPGMCLFDNPDNGKKHNVDDEVQERSGFFTWFEFECNAVGDVIGDYIKDELWPNPLQYFLNPEPDSDDEVDEDLLDEEDSQEEDEEEVDDDADQEGYDDGEGEDADDKE